jgi:hypothetical protein
MQLQADILLREEQIGGMRDKHKKMVAGELEFKKKKHEVEVEIDKVNAHMVKHQERAVEIRRKVSRC